MAEVVLTEIDKVYDNGFHAVKDLSLDIADGEFLVLVGPSGCGKTTALRMIAGLEEITDGELRIGDRQVNEVLPRDRDIAMVFQSYALYPHLSVRDNIGFGLQLRKENHAEITRRVEEAAALLDLTQYLDRKPRQLSGGQRQRVAMGRALVREPSVFLMDEPLSNLDAKLRVQMRSEIAQIQKRLGTTTIYVTHDQIEAMTMGDRVAVMRLGELQQVATPSELYDNPANVFVAGFIGTPPMNLLRGAFRIDSNGTGTLELGGENASALPASVLERVPGLREYNGKEVIIGARCEDIAIGDDPNLVQVHGLVELVEALGANSQVYVATKAKPIEQEMLGSGLSDDDGELAKLSSADTDGATLIAVFPKHVRLHLGESVTLGLMADRLYFFDAETGLAVH
jgi:multiple sugar transport system ATP-binding protein